MKWPLRCNVFYINRFPSGYEQNTEQNRFSLSQLHIYAISRLVSNKFLKQEMIRINKIRGNVTFGKIQKWYLWSVCFVICFW